MELETAMGLTPIVGIRAWGIIGPKGSRTLTPVADPRHSDFYPKAWWDREDNPWSQPGVWARGLCPYGLRPGTYHARPVQKGQQPRVWFPDAVDMCACGLWAQKGFEGPSLDYIVRNTKQQHGLWTGRWPWPSNRYVIGEVKLKGAVLEHTSGYRAELARPRLLLDMGYHQDLIEEVGVRYGVPVMRFADWAQGGGVEWLT